MESRLEISLFQESQDGQEVKWPWDALCGTDVIDKKILYTYSVPVDETI